MIGYILEKDISKSQALKIKLKYRLDFIPKQDWMKIKSTYKNVIVQTNTFDATRMAQMEEEVREVGITISSFSSSQILRSFFDITRVQTWKSPLNHLYKILRECLISKNRENSRWHAFKCKNPSQPIIICTPEKTADHTLNETFKRQKILFHNLNHSPNKISRAECEKIFGRLKILVGVREPISQNLSALYQGFTNDYIERWMKIDLDSNKFQDKINVANQYSALLNEDGNNVQALWNKYIELYFKISNDENVECDHIRLIQLFFSKFDHFIIDIYSYPFDQETGYTIIKEGNTEVFVYQLEKLNSIVPQLSEWVGVPFDKLERGNVGEEKWIGDSYKQAQKEIQITQEYFDRCFDEPYVKHFYSKADIEKFKARWRPHIKYED